MTGESNDNYPGHHSSTCWNPHLPDIPLVDRYADDFRSLRVAVIGAGLSGLIAGVLLPAKVPQIQLTIFEKNADVVRHTTGETPD
jgi:hypothetical protein